MTTQEIRGSILLLLDNIEDKAILQACHDLLKNVLTIQHRTIVAYDPQGVALDAEEYEQAVMMALEEAANGEVISHQDLKKQFGLQ